jgi:hypothetical protein
MFGLVFERHGRAVPREVNELPDVDPHPSAHNQDRVHATQSPAVVFSIDVDDRQHDQVSKQIYHHSAHADPTVPQDRRQPHIAN